MKKTINNPDPDRLRVLILEDNPADAELVARELRRAKIDFTARLVEGKREFTRALTEFQPQVILSDFKLPLFDGLAALEIARVQAPEIPFIFVSGSIGEEKAIELLSQGASDYIFKDNLKRLVPAVKRVVKAARLKLEKEKSDEELRRRAAELRLLAEAADRFVHINDLDEVYAYLAQTIPAISGADYLLLSLYDEKLQAVRPKIVVGFEPFRETIRRRFNIDLLQMVFYFKDMRPDDFSDFISRKLLPVREGLYGLANRKIPRAVCRLIEKMLAIGSMHTMGFSWENQLYGGLTVVFKKGKALQNQAQVETLLNQATVSIKRLLAERSLRENEEHLRQSEEYYRTLVQTSPDAIIIVDGGGRVTFASRKTFEIFGISAHTSLLGLSIMDFVAPEDITRVQNRMVEILSGRSLPQIREYRLLRHDHRPFCGEISSSPLRDAEDRNIGLLLVCRDISERKLAESQREAALEALRESEFQYKSLVDNIPNIIFTIDLKGKITFISRRTKEILGYESAEMLNMNILDFIAEEDRQRAMENVQKGMSREKIKHFQISMIKKSGERLFFECSFSRVYQDGAVVGAQGTAVDISEHKRAEELINAALKEKEVLLQEIHHRVKNNLQIISGLLTLQADQAAGKPLSEIFQESQDRIHSIALIHEKLYRSRNLAEIAFDEYLRALTENLFISHGIVAGCITVNYEMEPILFTIEKAIPLGLIVNELLTNALKHAFPAGQQGEIRITLQERTGTARRAPTDQGCAPTCELIVADNGIGLPAGFKADTQKSLGMHLVSMLAQQIQAELEVKTGPGTEFRLLFPGLPANKAGKDKDHGG